MVDFSQNGSKWWIFDARNEHRDVAGDHGDYPGLTSEIFVGNHQSPLQEPYHDYTPRVNKFLDSDGLVFLITLTGKPQISWENHGKSMV